MHQKTANVFQQGRSFPPCPTCVVRYPENVMHILMLSKWLSMCSMRTSGHSVFAMPFSLTPIFFMRVGLVRVTVNTPRMMAGGRKASIDLLSSSFSSTAVSPSALAVSSTAPLVLRWSPPGLRPRLSIPSVRLFNCSASCPLLSTERPSAGLDEERSGDARRETDGDLESANVPAPVLVVDLAGLSTPVIAAAAAATVGMDRPWLRLRDPAPPLPATGVKLMRLPP